MSAINRTVTLTFSRKEWNKLNRVIKRGGWHKEGETPANACRNVVLRDFETKALVLEEFKKDRTCHKCGKTTIASRDFACVPGTRRAVTPARACEKCGNRLSAKRDPFRPLTREEQALDRAGKLKRRAFLDEQPAAEGVAL